MTDPHPKLIHSLIRRLRRSWRAALAEPRYLDVVPALRDYPAGPRSLNR